MTTTAGLSTAEATRRLARVGPNAIATSRPTTWLTALRHQLTDPVVLVLVVALGLTLAVGDVTDATVIGLVIAVNSTLGTMQELRSAHALEALSALTAPRATVVRDGARTVVAARDLVPGDCVLLQAGDIVPADLRLTEAVSLQLDESMLTGESLPVDRTADEDALAATVVRRGRATATVLRTAGATEVGRLAGRLTGSGGPTPLQRQLAGLGRTLVALVGIVAIVVAAIDIAGGHGTDYSITIALSLAVAAIPESLPAVVTLALALAARRMAAAGVLARRLAAVEALGSVTVLAVDKTGTLTTGVMAVRASWTPADSSRTRLVSAVALCNDARPEGGVAREDPTDAALLQAALAAGLDVVALRAANPRVAEEPFDADLARMITSHRSATGTTRYAKGSVEAIAALGATAAGAAEAAARFAAAGDRVLAAAVDDGAGWRLLGVLGLADDPRPETAAVVAAFQRAGVRPVMITGDAGPTAQTVARAVGIPPADVYARVRPLQKADLVERWQRAGEVVAMTGDGVNDAAALRQADVGVAMGRRGTEVAKQAADLVLVDDRLSAMADAITEGRRAYDNVRRFLRYALSGGAAEVLVMLIGPLLGFAVPLGPGQILWVNLLTHGLPGVAMGSEAAAPDVANRRPRPPGAPLADRKLLADVGRFAVALTASSLGAAVWARATDHAWQSCLFLTLTFGQLAVALVLRPRWGAQARNPLLLWAVAVNVVLLLAAVWWAPMRHLLRTQSVSGVELLACLCAAAASTLAIVVLRRLGRAR